VEVALFWNAGNKGSETIRPKLGRARASSVKFPARLYPKGAGTS
jgi:hypothetical protein